MISTSTCLIVTGSALMPSTHADSHGAGHSLPVNSGKLFVACSRSAAARQSPGVDQVVPLRDQVAERAARMAERDAAVHAPPGLPLKLAGAELGVDLAPVPDPDVDRPPRRRLPRRGQEAPRVSHCPLLSQLAAAITASLTSTPSRSAWRGGGQHSLVVTRHHPANLGSAASQSASSAGRHRSSRSPPGAARPARAGSRRPRRLAAPGRPSRC